MSLFSAQARQRFSLLLLEEGEDYVADYNAFCRAPTALWKAGDGKPVAPATAGQGKDVKRLHGKARLCTKSIFFDSVDTTFPILRYSLPPGFRRWFIVHCCSTSCVGCDKLAVCVSNRGAAYQLEQPGQKGLEEEMLIVCYVEDATLDYVPGAAVPLAQNAARTAARAHMPGCGWPRHA